MPFKGGKNKRKAKKPTVNPNKSIVKKEESQEYARVTKMLGSCNILAICHDTKERRCRIRGSMRKRKWINVGDYILVSLRDFSDTVVDVIHVYEKQDIEYLQSIKEIDISNFNTEEDIVQSDLVDFTNEETIDALHDDTDGLEIDDI
jgi:translation initiation factor 1A